MAIIHHSLVNHVSMVKIQISFKVLNWTVTTLNNNFKQTVMVLRGESMIRHHIGLNRMHPDRRFCLTLSTNDSVEWLTKNFSAGWATKVPTRELSTFKLPSYDMAHSEIFGNMWWVLVLRQFMGVDFSGAPFGEFSELTNKGPQMGNTGK